MLLQETYFIAMATFAACGGSSYAYSIHNVNATNCRSRLRRLLLLVSKLPQVYDSCEIPVLIFSDDPTWCKEQEMFSSNRFMVSESGDNITDMCLMSMCDYQIMANSTFSWWGAWLSGSERVIGPKMWFGPDGADPTDIFVDRWEYLEV